MLDEQKELEESLAKIEARKAAFERSPVWFTVWDITTTILSLAGWLALFSLIVQCSCECLI